MDTMSSLPPELSSEPSSSESGCTEKGEALAEGRQKRDQQDKQADTSAGTFTSRMDDGKKLRLAMALIDGLGDASADKAAQHEHIRQRLARAAGQSAPPENAAALRGRIKSLARNADRDLAEQLGLLIRFDQQKLYAREGCRDMLVWMGVNLKIGRATAFEYLRVGRALENLPVLASLFTLGQVSYSQLREVTRYADSANDAEFAIAVLELSVTETIEYCRRFRHVTDASEDAELAQLADQDAAEAHAALRAFDRRTLSIREIDAHSTRISLELPSDLAAEFLRSLEQVEDWLREGGEGEAGEDATGRSGDGGSDESDDIDERSEWNQTTATQRRADAAVLMSRRSLAYAGEAVAMADRYRVHVNVGIEQLGDGPIGRTSTEHGTHGSNDWNGLVSTRSSDSDAPVQRPYLQGHGPVSPATARRLAAAAGYTLLATDADGDVIGTARRAPLFTRRQRRILQARDRCCQVPGCGSTRHLDAHHVAHRENGGGSGLSNAALACGACHRLLHEGGFRLEPIGPNGPVANPLSTTLPIGPASIKRARSKIACIQRFRLYAPNGREYGSIGAAKEAWADYPIILKRGTRESTRRDLSDAQSPPVCAAPSSK